MQPTPSHVILGCGTFGGIGGARQLIGNGLAETAAEETLDEAVRLGILWWDTAERYADGASEKTIGAWLSRRTSGCRRGHRLLHGRVAWRCPTVIFQVTRHPGPLESTGLLFLEGAQTRGSGAQADLPVGQCLGGCRGVGWVR
jgi:hypothetical protein